MKAAVLGANTDLGRRIVLRAEEEGINVTSIVSTPADLAGNGPIIIKEPQELEVRELSRFHVFIDALSFPQIRSFKRGEEPLSQLQQKLAEAGTIYLGVGDCSLLYTDESRTQLTAESDLLQAMGGGSSDPRRCLELYQRMLCWPDLRWILFCPPLLLDTHSYGRGRFELTGNVLPIGLDGSSRIALSDFVSALIELLKVRSALNTCISVRGLQP
ncbi:MAG: hypothetical protein IAB19_06980 [Proteobacteria bacterium]|uniref:NADH-flavin reductase n=1 Tax=Candidatus Avisuccinivibrio stercorigallinarum TaxID=2840704 RepID=A0A9D9DB18_9GAMM|nr:hypothetical protein [Candidatus Avisuccinivibrio stercorigallinarum]